MDFDRKKVAVNQEIVHRPAEHEVFLSFNTDEQAVLFHDWLHSKGWDAFEAWLKKRYG